MILVQTLDVAMEKTNRKRVAVGKQSKSSFYIQNCKSFVASFYSMFSKYILVNLYGMCGVCLSGY
jgi:hypothetical protein